MSKVQALARVRALIAAGWTQHTQARNEFGAPRSPYEAEACQWCIWGAICASVPREDTVLARELRRLLGFEMLIWLQDWNDAVDRTQAQVLARIDDAMARA